MNIRNRRHFLQIASAAAMITPFFAATAKAENPNEDTEPGCNPSGGQPQKCECLFRGTEILSDNGYIAVENLKIGDLVVTDSGKLQPVKWIAKSSFAKTESTAWKENVLPVCIKKSAIDFNVPSQDLYVSPSHSLFVDGFLIPARYLVNGTSIIQSMPNGVDVVEYFHVEFEQHEVMFANGVALESLMPSNDHKGFSNFKEYTRIFGAEIRTEVASYAPVLGYNGGKQNVVALVRLAVSRVADVRDPIQVVYDRIVSRAKAQTRAA
jgi:hypothetical protein